MIKLKIQEIFNKINFTQSQIVLFFALYQYSVRVPSFLIIIRVHINRFSI